MAQSPAAALRDDDEAGAGADDDSSRRRGGGIDDRPALPTPALARIRVLCGSCLSAMLLLLVLGALGRVVLV